MAEGAPGRVPGAERALGEEAKLTGWVLAERGHGPDFARALGVGSEDRDLLRAALLAHVREHPPEAGRPGHPLAGPAARLWSVSGPLEVRGRRTEVMSVWEVPGPGGRPRLVTAYPRRPGRR